MRLTTFCLVFATGASPSRIPDWHRGENRIRPVQSPEVSAQLGGRREGAGRVREPHYGWGGPGGAKRGILNTLYFGGFRVQLPLKRDEKTRILHRILTPFLAHFLTIFRVQPPARLRVPNPPPGFTPPIPRLFSATFSRSMTSSQNRSLVRHLFIATVG